MSTTLKPPQELAENYCNIANSVMQVHVRKGGDTVYFDLDDGKEFIQIIVDTKELLDALGDVVIE